VRGLGGISIGNRNCVSQPVWESPDRGRVVAE